MNCTCECNLEPKVYTKFKPVNSKIQRVEIKMCPKTGFTIDSSLENYEETREQPCNYYEETIVAEALEEINENTEIYKKEIYDLDPTHFRKHNLTSLITYFLADKRRESYEKIINEIPIKYQETKLEYIERLKEFLI